MKHIFRDISGRARVNLVINVSSYIFYEFVWYLCGSSLGNHYRNVIGSFLNILLRLTLIKHIHWPLIQGISTLWLEHAGSGGVTSWSHASFIWWAPSNGRVSRDDCFTKFIHTFILKFTFEMFPQFKLWLYVYPTIKRQHDTTTVLVQTRINNSCFTTVFSDKLTQIN